MSTAALAELTIPSNFLERAMPLIRRGISVIPLIPRDKKSLISDWPNRASNNPKQIESWHARWPDANVGCVATMGFCFLDDDRGDLKECIERETGKRFPLTFTVETSVKSTGMRGKHFYFRSTVRSIALGHCACPGNFDFQAEDGFQVVGPYSVHPSGTIYQPVDPKAPIAEIPDWLCDWIEQTTPKRELDSHEVGDGPVAHEDWDSGAWLDHYNDVFTTAMDGDWHITSICPLTWTGDGTGHRHRGSVKTGFRFNGTTPEFHCFSTDPVDPDDPNSLPHDQVSFAGIVKHLNKYHASYRDEIWKQADDDSCDWAEIEEIDDGIEAAESPQPEKCYATGPCACGLEHPRSAPACQPETPKSQAVDASTDNEPEELILLGTRKEQLVYAAVTSMDKVIPKPLEWLWDQKILLNYLTIFGGQPERCKSLAAMDITAVVTTGRDWPDGTPNRFGPKTVLLMLSEDGLANVVWARLTAAGADLSRVKAIKGIIVGEENKKTRKKRMMAFKEDMSALRKLLKRIPDVALMIVDPITSYYGCDANKTKEIKPVMDGLKDLCEETNTAMVAVAHFSKRSDVDALQKLSGDVSIGGTARVVWTFSEDPDTDGEYLMTNTKGNYSRDKSGLRCKPIEVIVDLPDGNKQPTPKMEWLGRTDIKAQDVLDKQRDRARNGGADRKLEFAKAFLRMKFSDRPQHKCTTLYAEAEAEGINDRTLKRARIALQESRELNIQVDDRRSQGDGYWWILMQADKTLPDMEVL